MMDLTQFPNDHVVHIPGYGEATLGDIRRTEAKRAATEAELAMELHGYISLLPERSSRSRSRGRTVQG